jgi:hypothetical protein
MRATRESMFCAPAELGLATRIAAPREYERKDAKRVGEWRVSILGIATDVGERLW